MPTDIPLLQIRRVHFRKGDDSHIAEIVLSSGEIQSPTHKALRRHIYLPRPSEWEDGVVSWVNQYAVFCLGWASLQGGAIAVWNSAARRWDHCCNVEYVACAMLALDLEAVITFHCVSNFVTPLRHEVDVTRFRNPNITASLTNRPKPGKLDLGKQTVLQSTRSSESSTQFGPAGIYRYGNGDTFLAYDSGYRINFTAQV